MLLTALLALVLGLLAPANASTTVVEQDTHGDAPAALDLFNARATYTTQAFQVRVRVRDLRRTGKIVVGTGISGWGYNYIVTKTRRGITKRVHGYSEVNDLGAHPCPGITVTWRPKLDVVWLRLPIACSGSRAFYEDDLRFNGVDFARNGRRDRFGQVFYRP